MNFKKSIKSVLPTAMVNYYEEIQRRELACKRFLNTPPGDYYSLNPFDYYKCIFVHIPKAAGISVNKTLFGNFAGGHQSINDYKKIFPQSTFNKYFKFTIVRHPESRIISAFNFLKAGGFNEEDRVWANDHLEEFTDINLFIENWLHEKTLYSKDHFTPQTFYLKDIEGNLPLDFIGKFENLKSDFNIITKKLNITRELYHSNKTYAKRSIELTANSKEKIKKLYAEDFKSFNYK